MDRLEVAGLHHVHGTLHFLATFDGVVQQLLPQLRGVVGHQRVLLALGRGFLALGLERGFEPRQVLRVRFNGHVAPKQSRSRGKLADVHGGASGGT